MENAHEYWKVSMFHLLQILALVIIISQMCEDSFLTKYVLNWKKATTSSGKILLTKLSRCDAFANWVFPKFNLSWKFYLMFLPKLLYPAK